MSKLCSAKASSMSRWVHWKYHSPAKFNLSRPIWSTHFWSVGRDTELMREVSDESNECDKSSESSESIIVAATATTYTGTATSCGISCQRSGTATATTATSSSATANNGYEFGAESGEEIGIIGKHYKFSDD